MMLRRRPYPSMYQFLIDQIHEHLFKAQQAMLVGDHAKYVVEVKEARRALRDFQILIDEFKPSIGHDNVID